MMGKKSVKRGFNTLKSFKQPKPSAFGGRRRIAGD
jgi:hypothetical protein